jgi:cytochrome c oxidase subunit IV
MARPVITPRTYAVIYAVLLSLTLTTYLVAFVRLGHLHVPVALAIAVTKAALVTLFFMHLWGSTRLTWLVVFAGVLFLGILLTLTLSDYWSRDWLPSRDIPPSLDRGLGPEAGRR